MDDDSARAGAADTLVWPPPDEELDALVALPLMPSEPAPANAAPAVGRHPAAQLPLTSSPPADVLHGLADFADRHIAGEVVLHPPPASAPRLGLWALGAAGLALSTYLVYALAALIW